MKNLPGPRVRRAGLLAIALLAAPAAQTQERVLYRDPAAPIEQRVEDLLARMTQDEKIAQITAIWTKRATSPVEVRMPGGALSISWEPGGPVRMRGSATHVFEGELDLDAFA